jgi:hypothetical protein
MTMQQNLAKLSTRRTLSVVTGATHNIQEDHPSAIIDAARAEVEAVRRERHNRGAGTDLSKPGIPQQ